jgi:hypothetical protein
MSTLRALSALAALICAPAALAFDPTGAISFQTGSGAGGDATFDKERVVGPTVNVSREEGAGWSGDLSGSNMALEVSPTRLRAAGVSLTLERKPGELRIEGLFFGQRVRLELTGKTFTGRYGSCSFDLAVAPKTPGLYRGDVGCMKRGSLPAVGKASMRLAGDAATSEPPLPQTVLALLAVLPS